MVVRKMDVTRKGCFAVESGEAIRIPSGEGK
jgi:hypothetical protein